ncbi:MAG: hypothetical protein V3T07_03990 [Myxococcota bacterium]
MSCRARPWLFRLAVCSVVLFCGATPSSSVDRPSSSQRQRAPHGLRPGPLPLHARLEQAQAAALVVVDAVEPGRLHVRDAVAVLGRVDPEFQIKRSPLDPPKLAPGDHALLLLRGARSPYILVDEAREIRPLDGPAARQRWKSAVAEILARRSRSHDLLALYESWLDGPNDDLREEALRAVADRSASFHPLPEAFLTERIAAATQAGNTTHVRSAAAYVATLDPVTSERLLMVVPSVGGHASSEVILLALRSGVRFRLEATRGALLRSLVHEDSRIRAAALLFTEHFARDHELRDAVARLADTSDEAEERAAARRALDKMTRVAGRAARRSKNTDSERRP